MAYLHGAAVPEGLPQTHAPYTFSRHVDRNYIEVSFLHGLSLHSRKYDKFQEVALFSLE